jgi:acetyl-CoA synthetase
VTNYAARARIMFGRTPVSEPLRPGSIGIVTQSGSVSMSLVQMIERGMSVSHSIPIGNAADVDIADLIAYLATDDACGAIACAFEGVNHPHRLIEAAELARSQDKPLVVFKMASSEQGAVAAMSHSGSLAGSHAAYKAALERAGAVLVDNLEDIAETTAFFAKAGRPTGEGVAIVLGSGGLGVCAADKAEEAGVPLPQPTGRTLEILEANVPEFGAARNPCDVTGVSLNDVNLLEVCATAMLEDPVYSTLMVVQPYADEAQSARVPLWARLAKQHGKVICNLWSTESLVGHGALEVEREPHMATFRSLRRMFGAVAAWHAREKRRVDAADTSRLSSQNDRAKAAALLRNRKNRALTEREAKAALACYGIPVVQERLVATAREAAEAAEGIGFPIAMKVESPDILHKTEAGIIRLGVKSEAEVEAAFTEIRKNAEAVPGARINGVLMQPMVPAGIEMMMGARIDPMFGPLVVVGLGGVMVELMKDTALSLAPVNKAQALAMIAGLKGASALKGFRGMPPVDMDRLAEIVGRFSEFVADHADTIEEVDVNPLICAGDRIVAVDALIVTNGALSGNR